MSSSSLLPVSFWNKTLPLNQQQSNRSQKITLNYLKFNWNRLPRDNKKQTMYCWLITEQWGPFPCLPQVYSTEMTNPWCGDCSTSLPMSMADLIKLLQLSSWRTQMWPHDSSQHIPGNYCQLVGDDTSLKQLSFLVQKKLFRISCTHLRHS